MSNWRARWGRGLWGGGREGREEPVCAWLGRCEAKKGRRKEGRRRNKKGEEKVSRWEETGIRERDGC